MAESPRTALVLAGGGLVGGAWMVGTLQAIATETGWDPGSADYVVGTSAGSMLAAMLVSAVPPWLLMAYGSGEPLTGLPGLGGPRSGRFGASLEIHWSFPRPVLASPELALRSLREPFKYGPAGIVAWLPQGMISTEPLKSVVRRVVPKGWAVHPHLWIVAIDYNTGERVAFGRRDSPEVDLADAVAASCAIPGFYRPVDIQGRRYIDGGMYSPTNLDLAGAADADLVICLNPMSSRHRGGLLQPSGPIAGFFRGNNRRLVDREVLALRRKGKRVLLIEPQADDLRAMGYNYMSRKTPGRVLECAVRTTTASLRGSKLGSELSSLPRGRADRLSRPDTKPSSWPSDLFPPGRQVA
jgi:NTE family protein